ncbi:MAG: M16 family metallopeptidase [Longimicrobiales bacterium]
MTESEIERAAATRVHRLDNGLTLVVREDRRAPVVAIVTRVAAGYFDESDEVVGISHVLEHMFFKGTATRGPGEIGRETKHAGGYLNASTIYDRTLYHTVLPSESLAQGLELQSDALLNAAIDADELLRELRVITEEARRKRDNPRAVASESLYALMFDRHRMRRWRIGEESQLAGFTRADVHAFYRAHYRGSGVVLSVVGDVDSNHVVALVERHYAALDGASVTRDSRPTEPERTGFRYGRRTADIASAYLEWGWQTQGALHPDAAALDVLAIAFGQGRASRLYRAVRDAGHAQVVDAHHYSPEALGVFNVSVETTAERIMPALTATADELQRALAAGFDDQELERVRNLVHARRLRRLESVEGQANLLAEWQALGDWQLAAMHHERMLATDAAAVREVAQRYLLPARASLLVYAPDDVQPTMSAEAMNTLLFGSSSSFGERLNDGRLDTATPAIAAAGPTASARLASDRTTADSAGLTSGVLLEDQDEGVRFYRSSSGARIVVLQRSGSGLVSLAIAAPGGSCMESEAQSGVTALTTRTALKGTRRFTAAALAERTESLGGSIGASAGADDFAWSLSVPARHMEEGVALLAEAALHPTFPADELERERANMLAQLEQTRDDMSRYPLRLCLAAAFPHHPYGCALDVQEAAVRTLTRSAVTDWHRQLVHAAPPWCFVVGDIDADTAARICAAHLDSAPAATDGRESCASPAVWPASPARAVVNRPRAQTALALAFPGPHRNEPDADALRLLGVAIGGLGGHLFEELRSRRSLAYTVSAAPLARRHGGAFIAYIATSPEREDEARQALLEQLTRLRDEPIDDAEIERARRYAIGARRIRRQTNTAHLNDLMDALLLGRGVAELRDYEQRIAALDSETLRTAAERWLDPARLVEGVVRGEAAVSVG